MSDARPSESPTLPPSSGDSSSTTFPATTEAFAGMAPPGYEIQEELGRGGMGVVYKARQTKLGRPCALKMILSGAHAGADDLARFQGEAEAIARLQHPNIVQIFEVGTHGGKPFMALEFCPGGSLDRKLAGTPMKPTDAASLVLALAVAVQAAHKANVIHRDLKPANVLLAGDGTPKVTDFGLAKRLDGDSGQTRTGAIMGTPSYMAPEQAEGKKDVGPAADVYSLGAILYECLTGRPPFKAASPLDTIMQVVGDEPVPPRTLNPSLPRDLETVCLKCLAKESARRYGSAAELADDLGRFLDGEPVKARPVGRLGRLARWARREPVTASLVGAVAVLLLVGSAVAWALAGWALGEKGRADNEAGQKVQEALAARKAEKEAKDNEALAKEREDDARKSEKRAKDNEALAEKERKAAEFQAFRAEDARHAIQLDLAVRAWEQNDVARAESILDEVLPRFQGAWETRHVRSLCRRKVAALLGHAWDVRCVAYSTDGKRIASGSRDATVRVWDAETGQELRVLKGHTKEVWCVAFSPDGKWIASAGDRTVRVWDAETGREIRSIRGHADWVTGVAFSPDGKHLAGTSGVMVHLWDAATGKAIRAFKGHTKDVGTVAFSPDGKRILSGSLDETVRLWDAETGQEVRALKVHDGWVRGVAYSPDGTRVAGVGDGGTVHVWDAETGRARFTIKGHEGMAHGVAFSPDSRVFVTGGWDKTVKVWDAETGQEKLVLKGYPGAVYSVAFSPDGRQIVSGSDHGALWVWDARAAQWKHSLKGHIHDALCVAFSSDGGHIATAGRDQTVRVWDAKTGREARTMEGHADRVNGVAFSPDGKRIATASRDHTVRIWDARTGRELLSLKGHKGWVLCVAFSPDGKWIASGSHLLGDERKEKGASPTGVVKVWDAESGQEKLTVNIQAGPVTNLAFSPDSKRVACAAATRVSVLDARGGKELLLINGHSGDVWGVAFSRDGKRIASGSKDGTARIWDAETGQEMLSLKGHSKDVTSVSFSPDGKRIVSGSKDTTVRVWDAESGQEKLALMGHPDPISSVAFSPDGKRIASSSGLLGYPDHMHAFGGVRVWDTETGQKRLTLRGHRAYVLSVAISPDGKRIASGWDDNTVRVWDARTGQEMLSLRGHAGDVRSVAFSPDGKRIASKDDRGRRLDFEADTGKPLRPDKTPLPAGQFRADQPGGGLTAIGSGNDIILFGPVPKVTEADRTYRRLSNLAWHAAQGEEWMKAKQHAAVAFHLERLHRSSIDPILRHRLDVALKEADDSPMTRAIKRDLAATNAARVAGPLFLPPLARPALLPRE